MGRHASRSEIAMRARLSEATGDTVIDKRGDVCASAEREVHQATADGTGGSEHRTSPLSDSHHLGRLDGAASRRPHRTSGFRQ
jgi:hypothetical protein